jgi:voltage-gated potassium channel
MDERSLRIERRLEWPLLVAALLTVPMIAIQESDTGAVWDAIATTFNWATWLAFLGEIAIMLRVVPDRRVWLREHWLDVTIVVLTPPFLPGAVEAARAFRLLSLLRLVRGVGIARHLLSTEGVRDAGILALMTVIGGGIAFAAVEEGHGISAWDGIWWAITTVATVGYGDIVPHTTAGRMIAISVMLVGIGFLATVTAAAAQRLVKTRQQEERVLLERLDEILRRLDAIERRQSEAERI